MESRIRLKIGEIEFEAEGPADIIERERKTFMQVILPAAIDATIKTHQGKHPNVYNEETNKTDNSLNSETDKEEYSTNVNSTEDIEKDYSRISLTAYLKAKGALTEEDFILFAAYFDEKKNKKEHFTNDDVKEYYSEARRKQPSNIYMSLARLVKKGYIMDANKDEQKNVKPYMITLEGINYIKKFSSKDNTEKKHAKPRKTSAKTKSEYINISLNDLNLSRYPKISSFKDFKEKMMLVLYIITVEKAGEWFTTTDVMYLLTDVFGEAATINQINGVFKRKRTWFKAEKKDNNNHGFRRKLLNAGMDYAKSLIVTTNI